MSSITGGGAEHDQDTDFPNSRLRVLLVDADPICLQMVEKMLQSCHYQVTTTTRAFHALEMLRKKKKNPTFDIVISDVCMPDLDGIKLLEQIGAEMNLPVIMMSAEEDRSVIEKAVIHGACDYLIKPIRIDMVKNIWQHVVRKRRNGIKDMDIPVDNACNSVSKAATIANYSKKTSKKRKEDHQVEMEDDITSTTKKSRVIWSDELHQKFVTAVNQLGLEKAVPKRILELMEVSWITRENVASHLQKYRQHHKQLNGAASQHQSTADSTQFLVPPRLSIGELPLRHRPDLHDQFHGLPQRGFGRFTTNNGLIDPPFVHPRDPNTIYGVQRHMFDYPTSIDNRQHVAYLHQTAQSIGTMQVDSHYANQHSSRVMPLNESPIIRNVDDCTTVTGMVDTYDNEVSQFGHDLPLISAADIKETDSGAYFIKESELTSLCSNIEESQHGIRHNVRIEEHVDDESITNGNPLMSKNNSENNNNLVEVLPDSTYQSHYVGAATINTHARSQHI